MIWFSALAWISVGAGLLTGLLILIDVVARPQRMPIMNIVWPVTGLYFPLVGWWIYRSMGTPPLKEQSGERPFWKKVFLSSTHCGSGCVLGDLIGPPMVFAFGWTLFGDRLFADFVAEFTFAYIFGIAFQFFPIMHMRHLPAGEALAEAIKADTLSLVAFEVGMFGWMAVVALLLIGKPLEPTTIQFWFMMQIGMVLGFITTFPANWLLISARVKPGM